MPMALSLKKAQGLFEFSLAEKPLLNFSYILDGHTPVPCTDLLRWGIWMDSNHSARVVKQTERDGVMVSTVFTGTNLSLAGSAPVLFETKVFGGEHDEKTECACTWEQAEAVHAMVCEIVFLDGGAA